MTHTQKHHWTRKREGGSVREFEWAGKTFWELTFVSFPQATRDDVSQSESAPGKTHSLDSGSQIGQILEVGDGELGGVERGMRVMKGFASEKRRNTYPQLLGT